MEGHYFRTGKLHHDKVCIRPIAHHYEEEGERPYIKYGCPVCEQFGARHSFAEGTPSCPMCGVYLLWHRDMGVYASRSDNNERQKNSID